MLRRAAVLSSTAALLLAAGPAAAQDPVPAPPTAPAPAQTTPPVPSPGKLSLRLERVNGRDATVLAGDRFRVRGTVKPYVPGQRVTVRVYDGKRKLSAKRVKVRRKGARGTFVLGMRAERTGHLVVRASHRATARQATMVARGRGLDVLPRSVAAGARGPAVRALQQHLDRLGYVVGERGLFDARTARAVLALRKVLGMARTTQANEEVLRHLARGQGGYKLKYPRHGKHVEADLSRQVMVLARGSKVERIYHVSSGAPATPTILGSFRFYRKDLGTNALGMVHSSYFIRGYAIHGYHSVPVFNASHGCLRVPIPDAMSIFGWISTGDRIDVYP